MLLCLVTVFGLLPTSSYSRQLTDYRDLLMTRTSSIEPPSVIDHTAKLVMTVIHSHPDPETEIWSIALSEATIEV